MKKKLMENNDLFFTSSNALLTVDDRDIGNQNQNSNFFYIKIVFDCKITGKFLSIKKKKRKKYVIMISQEIREIVLVDFYIFVCY